MGRRELTADIGLRGANSHRRFIIGLRWQPHRGWHFSIGGRGYAGGTIVVTPLGTFQQYRNY